MGARWNFYGRAGELGALLERMRERRSFFGAIRRRRRIGKTALIQQVLTTFAEDEPAGRRVLLVQMPDSGPADLAAVFHSGVEGSGPGTPSRRFPDPRPARGGGRRGCAVRGRSRRGPGRISDLPSRAAARSALVATGAGPSPPGSGPGRRPDRARLPPGRDGSAPLRSCEYPPSHLRDRSQVDDRHACPLSYRRSYVNGSLRGVSR